MSRCGHFERLRTWRLQASYVIFVSVPFLSASVALAMGHETLGGVQYGAAALFAVIAWLQWRHLKERYAKNCEVVAELERIYGDDLPWVKVDKHFAELEKLKREMAEQRAGGTDPSTGSG